MKTRRYNRRQNGGIDYDINIINNIPNIGRIKIDENYVDAITMNTFKEGEKAIRLQKNDRYVFKPIGIKRWVARHGTNPLTRNRVSKANMERGKILFTLPNSFFECPFCADKNECNCGVGGGRHRRSSRSSRSRRRSTRRVGH